MDWLRHWNWNWLHLLLHVRFWLLILNFCFFTDTKVLEIVDGVLLVLQEFSLLSLIDAELLEK